MDTEESIEFLELLPVEGLEQNVGVMLKIKANVESDIPSMEVTFEWLDRKETQTFETNPFGAIVQIFFVAEGLEAEVPTELKITAKAGPSLISEKTITLTASA